MDENSLMAKALAKIVPESIRKQANDRIEICNSCDKLSASRKCLMCGCFMDVKVYIPDAKCPVKKW